MGDLPLIEPERTFQLSPEVTAVGISFSPDGQYLAVVDTQSAIWIWSTVSGQSLHRHEVEPAPFRTLAWSSDSERILLVFRGVAGLRVIDRETGTAALATLQIETPVLDADWLAGDETIVGILEPGDQIFYWDPASLDVTQIIRPQTFKLTRVRTSPSSNLFCTLSEGGNCDFYRAHDDRLARRWHFPHRVYRLAWSRDGVHLATSSVLSDVDPSILRITSLQKWLMGMPQPTIESFDLEGHGLGIAACDFSADSRLLISVDLEHTVFVWDLETRAPVFKGRPGRVPNEPNKFYDICGGGTLRLAEVLPDLRTIVLYNLAACLKRPSAPVAYLKHTSAKVVIAGEARVGKTSLAHRLVEDRYVEHESTHGVKFWPMAPAAPPAGERREVILWDLGGQEEYQLIHQLFLRDTTVALLLFDPARGAQALEEVEAWSKRLAKQLHGKPVRKLLVGTKQDADVPVDRQSIDQLVKRAGFDGYFSTSAKEGHGFQELHAALASVIDWASLSTVSRPEFFQLVRDKIEEHRRRGEIVLHYKDLLTRVGNADGLSPDTVVRQLSLQGVIAETRDSQGERTLVLQVSEVERYAGSLLIAARDNPSGVPALEKSLLSTRMESLPRIAQDQRLLFREERWVLECVLQLMLEHGLCVEHAGLYVFPTLFRTSDVMPQETPVSTPIFYEFSGAIDNIYSSLVAAFAISKRFGRMRLGKDRAEFEDVPGSICGLRKVDQAAGVAHLDLYFGDRTAEETRELFRGFLNEHLQEHGVEIVERLNMRCSKCDRPLDESALRERLVMGEGTVLCQLCEHRNQIALPPSSAATQEERTRALRGEIAEAKRQAIDRARALIPRDEAPAPPARPTRILHLSDLHLSEADDVKALLEPLLSDLNDQGLSGALDCLVISGDLTNRATPGELARAYERVSTMIDRLGLSAQRCLVVPGNHDLSWDEPVYEFKMPRQLPASRDARFLVPKADGFLVRDEKRYPERFRNFSRHFFHPLFQQEYPLDPLEQCLTSLLPERGLQLLAFNSAWEIDEHFQDRASLHQGAIERCLLRAANEVGRLKAGTPLTRIAVWHHPVTGNEKIKDDAFLERLRQMDVRICLHGHVHEDRADLVAHTDPVRKLYTVGAGSFGAPAKDRSESTPRLYNILEIDPGHRSVRVHTRARPRAGGAWRPWAVWPGNRADELRAYYEVALPAPFTVGSPPTASGSS